MREPEAMAVFIGPRSPLTVSTRALGLCLGNTGMLHNEPHPGGLRLGPLSAVARPDERSELAAADRVRRWPSLRTGLPRPKPHRSRTDAATSSWEALLSWESPSRPQRPLDCPGQFKLELLALALKPGAVAWKPIGST